MEPTMTHHDYEPGSRVHVQIADGGRSRWMAATFLGTAVGATRHSSPFLVVQTRDGRVWPHCSPRCVRAA
jgi:hypothetical protein